MSSLGEGGPLELSAPSFRGSEYPISGGNQGLMGQTGSQVTTTGDSTYLMGD